MIIEIKLKEFILNGLIGSITISAITYFYSKDLSFSFAIALIFIILTIYFYYFSKICNLRGNPFKPRPVVIFLTGLSGSGKTTIARSLVERYKEHGILTILLDGDDIRKHGTHSGFDEESRKRHNLNVGNMASLLEKQGHVIIVSLISPYIDIRHEIRKMCNNMIEVYVSTDIEVCIQRDPKGLYAKALNGEIKDFTGISAPYFPPNNPEVILDTNVLDIKECTDLIFKVANK